MTIDLVINLDIKRWNDFSNTIAGDNDVMF